MRTPKEIVNLNIKKINIQQLEEPEQIKTYIKQVLKCESKLHHLLGYLFIQLYSVLHKVDENLNPTTFYENMAEAFNRHE